MRYLNRAAAILLAGLCLGPSCRRPENTPACEFSLSPIPGRIMPREGRIDVDSPSVLRDGEHFVWGGSVVRGGDGRYHMFYSIFDAGPDDPPFSDAWLLSSRIAYAVSDRADGGFVFQRILLEGAHREGRPEAWDAQAVHNPHVKTFDGRYYLYYTGSRDPGPQPEGSPGEALPKRGRIQQTQKIGVLDCATLEDLVNGRFQRPEQPLLAPRTRVKCWNVIDPSPPGTTALPDNLVVVNPSVVFRPSDRKYLLYFKGNLYDPAWRGVHGVAVGDSPTGPFLPLDDFVFDVHMPDGRLASAEDPYVWYRQESRLFHAVFKDFSGRITRSGPGLALMVSPDGLHWRVPENPLFALRQITFEDGSVLQVAHLERPQLLIDPGGEPVAFYAACSVEPAGEKTDGSTFNIQMNIRVRGSRD